MSGSSSARRHADRTPSKGEAWEGVGRAQQAWAGAMRTHELAPPDARFRDRLRALAAAASAMRDAHAEALEAGLAWRPVKGSDRARPPHELRAGTGRRGPDDLWAHFDEAVAQLNEAGSRDTLADVVAGYAAVAAAAGALADALEAAGE